MPTCLDGRSYGMYGAMAYWTGGHSAMPPPLASRTSAIFWLRNFLQVTQMLLFCWLQKAYNMPQLLEDFAPRSSTGALPLNPIGVLPFPRLPDFAPRSWILNTPLCKDHMIILRQYACMLRGYVGPFIELLQFCFIYMCGLKFIASK